VLDVSRIVSGKVRLHLRPVDLRKVVRDACETVAPAAGAKAVQMEILIDPKVRPVAGDPDRLQQVLWNLLSNAVKFTPRNGRVQVELALVDSHVEVVVSDTGIGISSEFLPHIFERFRQAEGGTTRRHGGLGLGLAIARHIVEMHGGTIQAASEGEGKGSTFRIELPLLPVPAEKSPEPAPVQRPVAQTASTQLASLAGIRVLAVDDNQDALDLLREILGAAGAIVVTATSGAAAVQALQAAKADVLVVDLAMPDMDGFEFMRQVRRASDPALRQIPAAALTAYARSEDRAKALRSGFALHLSKPIDPAELLSAVAALSKRRPA
jgi:CheY-like chemotaxis protein